MGRLSARQHGAVTVRTIFKYPLEIPWTTLALPVGAVVLTVQLQGDVPTLWAIVDDEKPKAPRRFATLGTGHPFPWKRGTEYTYLSTVQMRHGIVLHVFEELA